MLFAFSILMLFYSFLFSLVGQFLLLQFMIPLALLVLLVIWLLPETRQVPTRALSMLSISYIFALLCWPDYLAFSFPGLPWITAIRLVGIPMMLVFLVCLSTSSTFRADLAETINAAPLVWKGLVSFTFIAILSVVFSSDVGASLNKLMLALVNWTMIFFCAAYFFRSPGRALQLGYVLWAIGIFLCLIAFQEWRHSSVPWAGHIPSFLKIEDENVQKIMSGSARSTTGIYRVQSKFTTPLSFAEYLSLATPFVMYFIITTRRIPVAVFGLITLAFFFFTIRNTDARLGVIGFFSSLLLTSLIWGALRWHRDRDSIFGPAVVLAFPAGVAAFLVASLYIGRLRAMVWGNGAQQFSNNAREAQWDMGIPMILRAPWGHGIGRGAATLGYTNLGGTLTIDTYYLTAALEFGVLGFFCYFGTFLTAIYVAGKEAVRTKNYEISMVAPLGVALVNFVIIKSVLSQQETHPLAFILLGAVVALVWRNSKAGQFSSAISKSAQTA